MNRKLIPVFSLALLAMLSGALAASAQQKPGPRPGQKLASPPTHSGPSAGVGDIPLAPVGSSFTYQGRLTSSGSPANGQFDLRFTVFDAITGTNQVSSPVTVTNQTVSEGLFTVQLDFGSNSFTGDARYIQIEVRPTGG